MSAGNVAAVEVIGMLVLLLLLEEDGSRRLDFAEDRRWDLKENWDTPRKEDIVNMLDYMVIPARGEQEIWAEIQKKGQEQ